MAEPNTVGQLVGSLDTSAFGALVHDAQMDYYGKRVAAASGDHSVQIWDITEGQQRPVGQVKGHEGPIWKVSWAHPKFGSLLATCSYDMKVVVWKEVPAYSGSWQIAYSDTSHTASVNDAQFCPWEHGLRLACASSDGTVSVLSYGADHQWRRQAFQAHAGGAQSVTWMPAQTRDGVTAPTMRLATAGCDCCLAVWKCEGDVWTQESPMPPAHTDWLRAVAWRPEGPSGDVIASGGWDKTVVVWAQEMEGQSWRQVCKLNVAGKVEGLAWSHTGSILAVSFGEGDAVMYKEAYSGGYEEIGKVAESGFTQVASLAPPIANGAGGLDAGFGFAAPAHVPPPVSTVSSEMAQQQQDVLASFGM